ncbi:predicted protein [Naegleria gruberi]|uniref:Predicted protein n=1 Tax=Naegleria gruberi TaxID=5762 RepID=D2VHM8_NAEGR|nr:uncharacterized protein NAEGRDRAFT_49617 [Naegleria gruberi]EFC43707.1 predicted protein [Naegleria gruberi]|eukprot:XP_002676451.1 predicted protein [Naegleria gruberi strain NEG-M]
MQQQYNAPARPFRYEEKSVEDDFELVNVVSRTNRKSLPPSMTSNAGGGQSIINNNNQTQQYSGILSTATNRLSLSLISPVVMDGNSDRKEEVNNTVPSSLNNRRSVELVVEYNFRPDFEKEYIKRTEELMKREEEEEKTRKAKFIALLEELNSTKGNNDSLTTSSSNNNTNSKINKEVIPQNNFMINNN